MNPGALLFIWMTLLPPAGVPPPPTAWAQSPLPPPVPAASPQLEAQREAMFLLGEGDRLNEAGKREEAREKWLKAVEVYQRADNALGEADAYARLGYSYFPEAIFNAQKRSLALDYFMRTVTAAAREYESGIRKDMSFDWEVVARADILFKQAQALYEQHNCAGAFPILSEALALYQQEGFTSGEVRTLIIQAICKDANHDSSAAATAFKAIGIASRMPLGSPTAVLLLQADEDMARGRWQEAQLAYEEVIRRCTEDGNLSRVAGATLQLGVLHWIAGNVADSESRLLEALDLVRSANDEYSHYNEAVVRHNLAGIYSTTGRSAKAIEQLRSAVQLWQALGEPSNEVDSMAALGFALHGQGDYAAALSVLETAQSLYARLTPNKETEGDLLNNIALVYLSQGRLREAQELLQKALTVLRGSGLPQKEAMALGNLGSLQVSLGHFEEGLASYRQVLEIAQQHHVAEIETKTQLNIAGVHVQRGDYQAAVRIYSLVLPVLTQTKDLPTQAAAHANLGSAYFRLGDLVNAQLHFTQALEIYRQTGDRDAEASVFFNSAGILLQTGNTAGAEKRIQEALTLWRGLGNTASISRALGNLGALAIERGDLKGAIVMLEEAVKLSEEAGNRADQARFQLYAAGALVLEHDLLAAREKSASALDLALRTGDQSLALASHLLLALAHLLAGEHALSLEQLKIAIDLFDRWGGTITVTELKIPFLDQFFDLYALAVMLNTALGRPEEAFLYAEQARARAFLDQIGNPRIDLRHGAAPELIRQEQELRARLAKLRDGLQAEKKKPFSQQNEEQLRSLSKELEEARAAYDSLLVQLKLTNPGYSAWVGVSTLGIREVQTQVLDGNTTLIEYFVTEVPGRTKNTGQVLAWVIEQDRFQLVELEITAADLERSVSLLRALIEAREPVASVSAELYERLIEPLVPHIHHPNLVIVPHGVLHDLPFAALWDAKRGRYLLDDYAVSYAPSATALQFAGKVSIPARRGLLAIGNPDGSLPHAAEEARAVAALFHSEPLLGSAATESALAARVQQAGILHLAAHGVYNSINPLFTRIQLAPGDGQDGALEMHEVLGLDLTGLDMVVLGACATQKGVRSAGDDVVGLTRSFLYAGARSVVASLWDVDDEATALLMKRFYTHLRSGLDKAEALRRAQAETLARFPHPRDWAAFVLTGSRTPLP